MIINLYFNIDEVKFNYICQNEEKGNTLGTTGFRNAYIHIQQYNKDFFIFFHSTYLSSLVWCMSDAMLSGSLYQVNPGSTKVHTHQFKDEYERKELLSISREKDIICLIYISGSGLSLSSSLD